METLLTTLLGAGVLVAVFLAVRFPGSLRESVNVFAVLSMMLVMVYSVFMGQWAKTAALGVMVLIYMKINDDGNQFWSHDPDQD